MELEAVALDTTKSSCGKNQRRQRKTHFVCSPESVVNSGLTRSERAGTSFGRECSVGRREIPQIRDRVNYFRRIRSWVDRIAKSPPRKSGAKPLQCVHWRYVESKKHRLCSQLVYLLLPIPLFFNDTNQEEAFASFSLPILTRNVQLCAWVPLVSVMFEYLITVLTSPQFSPTTKTPHLLYSVAALFLVGLFASVLVMSHLAYRNSTSIFPNTTGVKSSLGCTNVERGHGSAATQKADQNQASTVLLREHSFERCGAEGVSPVEPSLCATRNAHNNVDHSFSKIHILKLWFARCFSFTSTGCRKPVTPLTLLHLESFLCFCCCCYSVLLPCCCDHFRVAALLGESPQKVWGREHFSDGPLLLALSALLFCVCIFLPLRASTLYPVCLLSAVAFQSATVLTGGADGLRPSIVNVALIVLISCLALTGRRLLEIELRLQFLSLHKMANNVQELQVKLVRFEAEAGIDRQGTTPASTKLEEAQLLLQRILRRLTILQDSVSVPGGTHSLIRRSSGLTHFSITSAQLYKERMVHERLLRHVTVHSAKDPTESYMSSRVTSRHPSAAPSAVSNTAVADSQEAVSDDTFSVESSGAVHLMRIHPNRIDISSPSTQCKNRVDHELLVNEDASSRQWLSVFSTELIQTCREVTRVKRMMGSLESLLHVDVNAFISRALETSDGVVDRNDPDCRNGTTSQSRVGNHQLRTFIKSNFTGVQQPEGMVPVGPDVMAIVDAITAKRQDPVTPAVGGSSKSVPIPLSWPPQLAETESASHRNERVRPQKIPSADCHFCNTGRSEFCAEHTEDRNTEFESKYHSRVTDGSRTSSTLTSLANDKVSSESSRSASCASIDATCRSHPNRTVQGFPVLGGIHWDTASAWGLDGLALANLPITIIMKPNIDAEWLNHLCARQSRSPCSCRTAAIFEQIGMFLNRLQDGTDENSTKVPKAGSAVFRKMSENSVTASLLLRAFGNDFWGFDYTSLQKLLGKTEAACIAGITALRPFQKSAFRFSSSAQIVSFVDCLMGFYPSNLYHNAAHAALVAHSFLCFCNSISRLAIPNDSDVVRRQVFLGGHCTRGAAWNSEYHVNVDDQQREDRCGFFGNLPPHAQAACVVAALAHDVAHPGTTNAFHISSQSLLAITYNDSSVLEQFHASVCFYILHAHSQLTAPVSSKVNTAIDNVYSTATGHYGIDMMRDKNAGLLSHFSASEYSEFRKSVIDLILATDMHLHFQLLSMLKVKNANDFAPLDNTDDSAFLIKMLLKAADLCHASFRFPQHLFYSSCIAHEFFQQGDLEGELGLSISPLCNRLEIDQIPSSQAAFLQVVCLDLFSELSRVESHVVKLVHEKERNVAYRDPCARWDSNKNSREFQSRRSLRSVASGHSVSRICSHSDSVTHSSPCTVSADEKCDLSVETTDAVRPRLGRKCATTPFPSPACRKIGKNGFLAHSSGTPDQDEDHFFHSVFPCRRRFDGYQLNRNNAMDESHRNADTNIPTNDLNGRKYTNRVTEVASKPSNIRCDAVSGSLCSCRRSGEGVHEYGMCSGQKTRTRKGSSNDESRDSHNLSRIGNVRGGDVDEHRSDYQTTADEVLKVVTTSANSVAEEAASRHTCGVGGTLIDSQLLRACVKQILKNKAHWERGQVSILPVSQLRL